MDELIEYLKQHNTPEIVILRVENMVEAIITAEREKVMEIALNSLNKLSNENSTSNTEANV